MIGLGYNRGQELALRAAEVRWSAHQPNIEIHENPVDVGVETSELDDVKDPSGAPDGLIVLMPEVSLGFLFADRLDPRHGVDLPVYNGYRLVTRPS